MSDKQLPAMICSACDGRTTTVTHIHGRALCPDCASEHRSQSPYLEQCIADEVTGLTMLAVSGHFDGVLPKRAKDTLTNIVRNACVESMRRLREKDNA